MSAGEIAAEFFFRLKRFINHKLQYLSDKPHTTTISDTGLLQAFDCDNRADLVQRMRTPRVFAVPGLRDLDRTVSLIKSRFPDAISRTTSIADEILNKRVRVFGRQIQLGKPIAWHSDPFTETIWPRTHFTTIPLILGNGSDIRVLWELNRLQHLTDLGRAYALTGDERYTEEFREQVVRWCEMNPPRFGPNWTVAMEVAIRAINLIVAFQFFRFSPALDDEFVLSLMKTLLAHGRFIQSNLEFSLRKTSNHYLSDLIGLFVLGVTLPPGRETAAWTEFARRALVGEMDIQVLSDGVDYEGSIAYHRFVVEIFTLFHLLNRETGVELPSWFEEDLENMYGFARAYLKPDGTAPAIGDSDDGRLIRFTQRAPDDHSYLLSMAAAIFRKSKFKSDELIDEETLWQLGAGGASDYDHLANTGAPSQESAPFEDAQIFIQRSGDLYLIADCGDHGARGRGSHAHSDALSFELQAYGDTFLRDPGTYIYTGSETWRNTFRSTAYHNTVKIDRTEISTIVEGSLFTLGPNVRPRINRWESTRSEDVLDAEHHAYERLGEPLVHRRIITFHKLEGYWSVDDRFTGSGQHLFEFYFNFDHGVKVAIEQQNRVILHGPNASLAITPVSEAAFELEETERWISPSYGTRLAASGIVFRLTADTPWSNTMLLIPYSYTDSGKLIRILNARGLDKAGAE